MRLPRGYKIETHQETDERGLCDTSWRVTSPSGEALNYPGTKMRPGDAEACEEAAWHDAANRWVSCAVAAGLTHDKRRGAEYARLSLGAAHTNIFLTGQVGFGGPERDRLTLAAVLREAGLLRGHDRAVQGGGWDLPAEAEWVRWGVPIGDETQWDFFHTAEEASSKAQERADEIGSRVPWAKITLATDSLAIDDDDVHRLIENWWQNGDFGDAIGHTMHLWNQEADITAAAKDDLNARLRAAVAAWASDHNVDLGAHYAMIEGVATPRHGGSA